MINKRVQYFSISSVRFSIYVAVLLLVSCAPNYKTSFTKEKFLPKSYSTSTDTSNIVEVNWKKYFSDPVLEQLVDSALVNNLDLQIALQKIEISRAGVKLAKGALLPQIGLNTGGGIRKFGLYTMDGAGNISTQITPGQIVPIDLPDMNVGLQASWEIDIWGKLRNQRKSSVLNYLATIEGTNFIISNLIADLANAYYELIALDNELNLVQKTILRQQDALQSVNAQKEVGLANELVLQQFSANLLHSKILEKETLQQIVLFENKINFLIGRFPQTITRNKELLSTEIIQDFNAGIPSQLLKNRPDIRKSELLVQASNFDLKSAKAAFYPNLNITAGFGFQAFNPKFLFKSPASLAYNTIGNLVAPVVNRNALKAHFNIAKAAQINAIFDYQKTILNGFVEISNELSNIRNLKEMNNLKKQKAQILNQSVVTSNQLFMVGKATYLEVLIAQQGSLQAEMELIINNKNLKLAGVNIYKALGGGWK